MNTLNIYTDGGARGNPGPAATGVVIQDYHFQTLFSAGQFIGSTTNNVAEYQAVIHALDAVDDIIAENRSNFAPPLTLNFFLDSKLVANQLSGNFKIKQAHLQSLATTTHQHLAVKKYLATFSYIPREKNAAADALVNQALDAHFSSS